jgi:hypothetical protein
MSLIIHFPLEIIHYVLEFISFVDIWNLDSAFTSKFLRPIFLEILSEFSFDIEKTLVLVSYHLRWIAHRGLKIRNTLHVGGMFDSLLFAKILQCKGITSLRISGCCQPLFLKPMCVCDSKMLNNKVTSIDLSYCKQITDYVVMEVIQSCQSLSTISLRRSRVTGLFAWHLWKCPHIISIDISGCMLFREQFVHSLATACTTLRHLYLNDCKWVSDHTVNTIADLCPLIETLEIKFCINITDMSVVNLSRRCVCLHSLALNGCRRLTDISITYLSSASKMKSLSLYDCREVTDHSILSLSRNCTSIFFLDLQFVYQVSDIGLKSISLFLHRLETLVLTGNKNISAFAVMALVKTNKSLASVHLADCSNITDEVLEALSRNCKKLTTLDISSCTLISDEGICTLAMCQYLRKLNIFFCPKITTGAVQIIRDSIPPLIVCSCRL